MEEPQETGLLEELKESPQEYGMLRLLSANSTLENALSIPDPKPLYLSLWNEGEVCCLFADSNLGKSILAVQIADEIARTGEKVLYYDFELSDKQFQIRYTSENGTLHNFPNTLYRGQIAPENIKINGVGNFEEEIIRNIKQSVYSTDAKVLIVDNLTFLCASAEKGDSAARLMIELVTIKKEYNLSMLILAHTPKRDTANPITANDLAGSRKLFNFCDSVFAIGRSGKDTNLRYIKQIKCRQGEFEFGADNVIVCDIEKPNSFVHFVTLGYSDEREHLKEETDEEKEELKDRVLHLRQQGVSIRDVAKKLSISASKVQRLMK